MKDLEMGDYSESLVGRGVLKAIICIQERGRGRAHTTHTHTHTQKGMLRQSNQRCEDAGLENQREAATSHERPAAPEAGRDKNRSSPVASGGTQAFRRPGFQASGLQNCQRRHFCRFQPELLAVCYLQQSQATQTSTTDGQKSHASRCSASC